MRKRASPSVPSLFAGALLHHQAGRLEEAERLYVRILQIDPRHADALHFRGVLAHQAGRHDAAVALIDQAIAQNGRAPAFHNNRGIILLEQGRREEAAASFERAVTHKPDYVEAQYNFGVALQALGNLEAAATAYERAVLLNAKYAEAHCNLGIICFEQGKFTEAIVHYERTLALKADYAEAHNNLGNALKWLGKLDEASAAYQRALTYRPDFVEARNNLGIVFLELDKADAAVECFERALLQDSGRAQTWTHLGSALKEQGKLNEAVAAYQRAVILEPDNADAKLGLVIAAIPLFTDSIGASTEVVGKFMQSVDELTAWSRTNLAQLGSSVGSNLPFYLAYRPRTTDAALSRYGELVCAAVTERWRQYCDLCRPQPPPRARIRLAIVSAHVRQHPVWDVILRGFLAHLDRGLFEIYLYHTKPVMDEEAAWAKSQVTRFVQGPMVLKAWLDEISQDRPDIMFYPEVGMDPTTYALAALRLAPLQIAGWGHPVTTGMPTIDLYVSGESFEGSGAAQHYREKLVRLPGTGVCTKLTAVQPRQWGGPPRHSHVVRFALCQQPIKFDPADDRLIACIAAAAGPSEFWLASPEKLHWTTGRLRDRLAFAFRAEGIDPEVHLRIMPWLPRSEFLDFLDEMDIYLDCPAFSGYTTAWQAVHRGLPIVTYEGNYLRQRLAAGLLRQIGLTRDIAQSSLQYVENAVRLARECREQPDVWAGRRDAIRRAAPNADGNRLAVAAFERTAIEALHARQDLLTAATSLLTPAERG